MVDDGTDDLIDISIPESKLSAFRHLIFCGIVQISRPRKTYQQEAILVGAQVLREMRQIEIEIGGVEKFKVER